jgi:tripartite-type tricarboxylate transporter receptor subunit TctC
VSSPVVTRRSLVGSAAAIAASCVIPGAARAQVWPSKVIKIVCGYPAGGLTDTFARAYGQGLSHGLGQPVVVDNRSGAGGSLAAQYVKASPPDGYTLLFANASTMTTNRLLYSSPGYDAGKDFALISYMPAGQLALAVQSSMAVANLKELADYARQRQVNVGTFGPGTFAHIATAELNKHYGLKMQAIHYRGEAPMWRDLGAGAIHAACGSYSTGRWVLDSGRGRAIAVTLSKRMRKLPDVPTYLEQGVTAKAFQLQGYVCMVAPVGTPQAIVERLSDLMVATGRSGPVQMLLDSLGIEDSAVGHEGFGNIFAEEGPVWVDLVRELGLTPE